MTPRKSPYSRRYKQVNTPAGSVFMPVMDDLPDDVIQWHYDWGIENEDYEYAQAAWIEAQNRGMLINA